MNRDALRIGEFTVVRTIGSGGAGTVYEAKQEGTGRIVALKVLHPPAAPQTLRRFAHESELLVRLKHPGIAAVHAASTHDGAPYVATELVQGASSIVEHASARGLCAPERVRLFLEACAAVEHAHRSAVIHRGLKPANVLVDAAGRVKVVDFGVGSAALADESTADTRTDVRALGAILHELLRGGPPGVDAGGSAPPGAAPADDLEWILRKSLDPDPERRYASVAELAADLERRRRHEPVLAAPPSAAYRLRKLARRHRAGALAATAAVAALVAGTTGAAMGLARAKRAEAAARGDATRAASVRDFLVDAFAAPDAARGRETKASALLDLARRRAFPAFAERPGVAAAVQESVGVSMLGLGMYADAEAVLWEAVAYYQLCPPDRDPAAWAEARTSVAQSLARALLGAGKLDASEEILRRALKERAKDDPGSSPALAAAKRTLSQVLHTKRKYADAEAVERRLSDSLEKARGKNDRETLRARRALAQTLQLSGKVDEAEWTLGDVVERSARALGEEHLETALARAEFAALLVERGKPTEAEFLFAQAQAVLGPALGAEHAASVRAVRGRAVALRDQGRLDEAEDALRKLLAEQTRVHGARHSDALLTSSDLASVLVSRKKVQEGEALYRSTLQTSIDALGETHDQSLATMTGLAQMLQAKGDLDEAESWFRRSLEGSRKAYGPAHWRTAASQHRLGALLIRMERFEEAEPLLQESVTVLRKSLGDRHSHTQRAMRSHEHACEKTRRPKRARVDPEAAATSQPSR